MADNITVPVVAMTDRQERALRRVVTALTGEHPEARLSDMFHDAAHDGNGWPDGEGGWTTDVHGFDCDDLAAVLFPWLITKAR